MNYIKLTTIEEYNQLNDAISLSRGYPDTLTGTARYAPEDPEPVEVKDENDVVIESYYEFPLTEDIMTIVQLMSNKEII